MSSYYSAITDFVTGRALLEGDRAVCIVLDIDSEPKPIYHPTDMAVIVSLPIFGRVGENDDFIPALDDYGAEAFSHATQWNWHSFSDNARGGRPVYREVKRHFTDKLLLAPTYVSESTFNRIAGLSVTGDDRQREIWNASEILFDALQRFRRGDKEDSLRVLMLDDPCDDEWQTLDGRSIAVPDLMRRLNASECRLHSLLKLTLKDTMRSSDTIFEVEAGYRSLHDLQSFSVGLFNLGKYFQPARRAGDMNLVDHASFMIGELQHILASAHLDPNDVARLRAELSDALDRGPAATPTH